MYDTVDIESMIIHIMFAEDQSQWSQNNHTLRLPAEIRPQSSKGHPMNRSNT